MVAKREGRVGAAAIEISGNTMQRRQAPRPFAPAPDAYVNDRDAAEVKPNGCRVYHWQMQREDTGETLFCARVWLPNRTKPVLRRRC